LEKLDYLINYLLKEKNETIEINRLSYEDKKRIYRSLYNIRDAKPISEEYFKIENKYLQEELNKKDITDVADIQPAKELIKVTNPKYEDKICLWKGDITTLKIDAIVNAANSQGLGCFVPLHSCVDNIIGSNAGVSLRLECNEIMKEKDYFLPTGETFITKGYNLPAKYIIHTVGPIIYEGVTEKEERELVNCYINSLKLAIQNGIRTIAFPCISTGEFRFPQIQACKLAMSAVEEFLDINNDEIDKIVFNVYTEEDYEIYEQNIRS
jgi:O-acetyl-ADP-ribose deacetylase (regulator of RNase III)